ncbi:MAG: ATP-binding protein [Oscillospiraceae bacterium]|nr:ATP-binding protein [Oscillospiraceae bacterium]
MPYNTRLLARARSRLAEIRDENAAERQKRIRTVYTRIPEIEAIDNQLRAQMIELARLAVSRKDDSKEKMDALQEKNLSLQMRRAELLVENGYPLTWTDEIYSCPRCHDTGKDSSGICSCLEALYNRELSNSLSSLLRNGNESFETFDLSLYSDQYSEFFQCVPREYMHKVFTFCREYAKNFSATSENLLFQGEAGLGKSYLSACIGREVAEKGYTVFYDTAVSVFSAFEKQQFSRDQDEAEAAGARVSNMLSCDLMILDDLGTEMMTPMVMSALYTLINSRLNTKKPTLINTTLYPDELSSRYSSSICSRLNGFYKTIHFAGTDIRAILKTRR